jgi:hypothetical protein
MRFALGPRFWTGYKPNAAISLVRALRLNYLSGAAPKAP